MIKLSCVVAEIMNDMEKGGKATLKVADASKKCYSTWLTLGFDAADGVKDLTVGDKVDVTITPTAVVTTGRDPLASVTIEDAEPMAAGVYMDRGGLERIDK